MTVRYEDSEKPIGSLGRNAYASDFNLQWRRLFGRLATFIQHMRNYLDDERRLWALS